MVGGGRRGRGVLDRPFRARFEGGFGTQDFVLGYIGVPRWGVGTRLVESGVPRWGVGARLVESGVPCWGDWNGVSFFGGCRS
jgi:hypothetical protein